MQQQSSEVCVLKVDLEYPKLHNNYLFAPDKTGIKGEMLPIYLMKVADFYNVPIGNIKKLKLGLKFKKYTRY